MAVRFDSNESYTRTMSLGTQTTWTVTCWVKIVVDTNTYATVWAIDNGTSDYLSLKGNIDGTTMRALTNDGGTLATRAFTVGTWYFAAISINATSGRLVTKALNEATFTTATWSASHTLNAASLHIGIWPNGNDGLDGSIAGLKIWQAALSQSEIEAEAAQFAPVRTSNLYAYYRFASPSTTDDSGNGRTLTGGTGVTADTDPQISGDATATPSTVHATVSIPGPGVSDGSIVPEIHSSSPPVVVGSGSITTAPFSPPAGSLLVAVAMASVSDPTISNSGTARTWTLRKQHATYPGIAIYTAPNPTAQSNITVTLSSASYGLKVYVVTSFDPDMPIGHDGTGSTTANAPNVAGFTATKSAALGLLGAVNWVSGDLPTSTDDGEAWANSSFGLSGITVSNEASAADAPVTFNLDASGTAAADWNWTALEILGTVPETIDATATPSAVAGTTTVPAPTPTAGSTASPTTVQASASIPAPAVDAETVASPSTVQAQASIPGPALSTGSTAAPATVAGSASIPGPSIAASSTASPGTVSAAASIPAPGLSAGSTASPTTVQASAAIPSPAASTGATASPGVVQAATTVPSPTVTAVTTASPSTVTGAASIPAPSISASSTAAPNVAEATTTIPAPTTSSGATANPGAVSATTTIPAPEVAADQTATPAVVAASATIPSPAVQSGSSTTASPDTLSAAATIPGPGISAGSTASASVVAATATIPAPGISSGSTASPSAVDASTAIPAPDVTTGAVATPGTVQASTSIPEPAVQAGGNATAQPSAVTASTSIPPPAVSTSSTAQPTVILATAAVPAPTTTTLVAATPQAVEAYASIPAALISTTARPPVVAAVASIPTPTVSTGDLPQEIDVTVGPPTRWWSAGVATRSWRAGDPTRRWSASAPTR